MAVVNPTNGLTRRFGYNQHLHDWFLVQEASANLGPKLVPDEAVITGPLFSLPVRDYRKVVAAYGAPEGSLPADFDRFLIERQGIAVSERPSDQPIPCRPAPEPFPVDSGRRVVFQAGSTPVSVSVRLVGSRWIDIGSIQAGQRGAVGFPALIIEKGWQVKANGACVLIFKSPN